MTRSLLLAFLFVGGASLMAAPDPSTPLAREVARLANEASLEAFAAPDSATPGRFIAMLRIPGQLLVVSAMHPSPATIDGRIRYSLYRDVYLDLQGTPTAQGKFFVQDAGEDGVINAARNSGTIDIVYRDAATTFIFNGDARGQKLSNADYDAALAKADADYAHMLVMLKTALEARRNKPAGQ